MIRTLTLALTLDILGGSTKAPVSGRLFSACPDRDSPPLISLTTSPFSRTVTLVPLTLTCMRFHWPAGLAVFLVGGTPGMMPAR
jgi:hypothetical protein